MEKTVSALIFFYQQDNINVSSGWSLGSVVDINGGHVIRRVFNHNDKSPK